MKLRLIKPGATQLDEASTRPPIAVPIVVTIRAWVSEFRSTKANALRLDFERVSKSGEDRATSTSDK